MCSCNKHLRAFHVSGTILGCGDIAIDDGYSYCLCGACVLVQGFFFFLSSSRRIESKNKKWYSQGCREWGATSWWVLNKDLGLSLLGKKKKGKKIY